MSASMNSRLAHRLGAAVPAAILLFASTLTQAQAPAPFAGFSGNWTGGGDIAMAGGAREKVRCKAEYSVPPSGEALHISINCASDSYKVQVVSNVVAAADGTLSGTWKELTRQADGGVTGRIAGPGQIQASLEGTVYGIQLSVTTKANLQAITIQSQGTDVQSVHIQMRKG